MRSFFREKKIECLFCLAVFLGVFVFFYAAHPLILLSLDDWAYFGYKRLALPVPRFWNPSRVLPEFLMPLCGLMTGMLYRTLFSDYVLAQAFTVALVASLFITFYIYAFFLLLRRRLELGRWASALTALIFLLLHFLVFRSADADNIHLFYTGDVTCLFFYTIPALLCAGLVMLDLSNDALAGLFTPGEPVKKSLLATALYFALFSNLHGSAILAMHLGCRLLLRLIKTIRNKERLAAAARGELPYLLALGLWIVAALFEMMGGRASINLGGHSLVRGTALAEALAALGKLLSTVSFLVPAMLLVCLVYIAVLMLRRRAEGSGLILSLLGRCALSGLLCAVFLLLLCSVVSPHTYGEQISTFGMFFYLFLILCLAGAWAVRRFPRLALALPLVLLILFSAIDTGEKTFADPNALYVSSQTVMAINRDLIAQLQAADEAGLDEVELVTMKTDMEHDNWPHSTYKLGGVLSNILWKHGVISRPMTITICPSTEFNARYHLVFGNRG